MQKRNCSTKMALRRCQFSKVNCLVLCLSTTICSWCPRKGKTLSPLQNLQIQQLGGDQQFITWCICAEWSNRSFTHDSLLLAHSCDTYWGWSEGWSTSPVKKGWESGAVQPGEENAPGTPYSSLPLPEGGLQESWRGTFYKGMQW